jgi:hypothetical protein
VAGLPAHRDYRRGLLMDLDATGDAQRTHQAFDDFLRPLGNYQ